MVLSWVRAFGALAGPHAVAASMGRIASEVMPLFRWRGSACCGGEEVVLSWVRASGALAGPRAVAASMLIASEVMPLFR